MHTLEINLKAESDIDKIAEWYDKRVPGLSFKFYDDLDSCFSLLVKYPSAFGYYHVRKK